MQTIENLSVDESGSIENPIIVTSLFTIKTGLGVSETMINLPNEN